MTTTPGPQQPPARLRLLADWFDNRYPNDADPEVQQDLRKWADEWTAMRAMLDEFVLDYSMLADESDPESEGGKLLRKARALLARIDGQSPYANRSQDVRVPSARRVARADRREAMSRLTRREMDLLARAAEYVLADEWPWPGCSECDEKDASVLQSARDKLRARIDGKE